MTPPTPPITPRHDPHQRRIRVMWRVLLGSVATLGAVLAWRALGVTAGPIDLAVLALVVLAGYAAVLHHRAFVALEARRRDEVESFARILRGLSRSISPDAIVDAIVEDLGRATGADHVVVVRRRLDAHAIEATLVSTRPGVPPSTTLFPPADLEDPGPAAADGPAPIESHVDGQRPLVPITVADGRVAVVGSSALQALRSVGVGVPGLGRHGGPSTAVAPPAAPAGTVDTAAADRIADRVAARVRSVYGLKHTLAAPLRTDAGVIGAIVLSRRRPEPWPDAARRLLAGAGDEASAALARAFSHRDAETRASTDALTGLPNRRYFDEFCGLLARRRRAKDAVGVMMVDIDRFKSLNDTFGHAVGDQVLKAVGSAIAGAVRDDDVPARYGGEEFAVLLRDPTAAVAVEIGERVRSAVAALDLSRHGVPGVSVSVGVAVGGRPDQPIAELIEDADAALYEAKRTGRDRVVAA